VAFAEFENALNNTKEIDLTVTGRVSGREISRPVWFVREREKLYLLPVTGSRSQWYKNLVRTPSIGLTAGGIEYRVTGSPVTDPAKVGHVVGDFRARYGAGDVAKYYSNPDVAVEVALN
jgi:hypothetical protein